MSLERREWTAIGLTIVVLAVWNVWGRAQVPGDVRVWLNAALGLVIAGIGLWAGLGADGLGLSPSTIGAGLLYGIAAFAVVAAVLAGASGLSFTEGLFTSSRTDVSASTMWFEALVSIPIGTVVIEELAFRGTLLGLALRRTSRRRAVISVSVLFGLWHLQGVIASTSGGPLKVLGACVGTFLATFVAGLVFAWLRLRSGSLVAPAMAHIATNSVALVLAWYLAH